MNNQANIYKTLEDDYLALLYDIDLLTGHKSIYDEVIKIINENNRINIKNSFYAVLKHGTLCHLIIGVRRHLKHKEESISLIGFLNDLIKNAHIFTEKGILIDFDKINADIVAIKKISKHVEHIADKYLAHIERKTSDKTEYIEFTEIDDCLKNLSNICREYKYIFNIIHIPEIEIIDKETWKDIFKTPWIEEDRNCSIP